MKAKNNLDRFQNFTLSNPKSIKGGEDSTPPPPPPPTTIVITDDNMG